MPRRRLVLAICCLSLLIVSMDVTIVNIALPAIRADLGADVSGLQWTIDAYILVSAGLLVLGGSRRPASRTPSPSPGNAPAPSVSGAR